MCFLLSVVPENYLYLFDAAAAERLKAAGK